LGKKKGGGIGGQGGGFTLVGGFLGEKGEGKRKNSRTRPKNRSNGIIKVGRLIGSGSYPFSQRRNKLIQGKRSGK